MSYQVPPNIIRKRLATASTNATTTLTVVSGFTVPLSVGTWMFWYHLIYQSTAAGTGLRFAVNFTGTATNFVWNTRWVDLSATASTGAADQDSVLATGAVVGAFASRAPFTTTRGTTISVDTANADMFMIIEGIANISVAGNLELWHGAENANSTSVLVGSGLYAVMCV
jgi:hypothetical protein